MASPDQSGMLSNLTVVVLSYNRLAEIQRNIPFLCSLAEEHGFKLIVVDNASDDGSREFLVSAAAHPFVRLVLNDANLGVGEGRNTGRRHARTEYVLHLDDDTRIELEDMRRMCAVMDAQPAVGVLSPRIIHATTGIPQNDHGSVACEVGNYHGACHLVRGEALRRVGDIDPKCVFGGEEIDYSIRMRALGYEVWYTPTVVVRHNNLLRKERDGRWRRSMRVYNFTRIHFKHFPKHVALVFSFRYCLSHIVSGIRAHGPIFGLLLPAHACRGAKDGIRSHHDIPDEVLRFYCNPTVEPDFGNVPILRKVVGRLRKAFRRDKSEIRSH